MHHVPESFARGGPTLKTFLVEEGTEDPNTTKSGPLSARQQNAILMVFRWRANDGPTLNAGLIDVILQRIRTRIAKKPYIFCDFSWGGGGGGPGHPLSPIWICAWHIYMHNCPLNAKAHADVFWSRRSGRECNTILHSISKQKKLFTFYAKLIWLHKQSRIESLIW